MFERNSRLSVANGIAAAIAINLMHPYIGIFAVRLGATDLQLGYLSSWPNVVSVIAVLGAAAAVARSQSKQRLIAGIYLLGRAAALGAAAVPWFPEELRIWVLIGFWVLSVFPGAAAGSALQAFLADVFPAPDRGRALASRQSAATAAGMVVVLVTGFLLDRIFLYPTGYQVFFALSFLVALVEVWFLLGLRESAESSEAHPPGTPPAGGLRTYAAVFSHGPFVRFLIASVLFHFTWQMVWPIFTRFQVSVLEANNTWLSMITVANSLAAVVSYPIWARYAARYGERRMLALAAAWVATAPLLTSVVPTIQWLVAVNLFTGVGVAGVVLLVLNNLLSVSPADGRPVYVAVHTALISVSASVAPMVGALIMSVMEIRTGLAISTGFRILTAAGFLLLYYVELRGQGKSANAENHRRPTPAA